MQTNIIVFYGEAGFFTAKQEIDSVLRKLGDAKSEQSLITPGIIQVQTALKPRAVIEELKESYHSDPESIKATTKWIPADHACNSEIRDVKEIIREDISYMITAEDKYALEYFEHNISLPDAKETIQKMLKGTIVKEHPDKILRVDVFEEFTAITLMRPKDVFERR